MFQSICPLQTLKFQNTEGKLIVIIPDNNEAVNLHLYKEFYLAKSQRLHQFIFFHQLASTCSIHYISQGGCGVSFSGDIQDSPGQGPVQPAVGNPASAGGLD